MFDLIYFLLQANSDGCHSMVGFQGGKQILNLEKDVIENECFRMMAIVHEFLHGEIDSVTK